MLVAITGGGYAHMRSGIQNIHTMRDSLNALLKGGLVGLVGPPTVECGL
jgi:hypothetical protein